MELKEIKQRAYEIYLKNKKVLERLERLDAIRLLGTATLSDQQEVDDLEMQAYELKRESNAIAIEYENYNKRGA